MKICIIGKDSYIGNHIDKWFTKHGHEVFQLDVLTEDWKAFDYSGYDAIVHVAGIVHRPDCNDADLYRRVNTEMPAFIAEKYKASKLIDGTKGTFVFLSTMAVFGTPKRLGKNVIKADTPMSPMGLYGQSKAAAEEKLLKLQDGHFDVVVVRPPNVYGKDCRGGYIPGFVNVVKKLPVIPAAYADVKQSMLYIDNLCEFIRLAIEQKRHGVFMPQDDKAVSAVEITSAIARDLGEKPRTSSLLGLVVHLGRFVPLIQKAYGGVEYDMSLSRIEGMDYVVVPFEEAMKRTINKEQDIMQKRICICTTLWSSIDNWIIHFLNDYHKRGVDVTIVCNMDEEFERGLKERYPFIHTHRVNFPRGINVTGSLKSIWALYRFFKKEKFDLVQYSTPNASMYGAVAAKMAGVPVRMYCQWGMVYVTMGGIKRKLFERIERMVCRFSTHVQPDSEGNLEFCRANGLYDEKKSCVIWNGSAKGLNLEAYDITKKEEYAREIKQQYGIPEGVPVVGFVGRLGREKGCHELFRAFQRVKEEFPTAKLLFVGPIEKQETMDPDMMQYFETCDDIIKTDRVNHVEKYTAAMDVYVLPSYREGFGMGVVEASAMGVPVVVTKYPGPSSAMEEGVSGYSVPVKDVDQLTEYILQFLRDPEKAKKMGLQGRKWVEERFDQKVFIQKYMKNRMELLGIE